MQMTLSNHVASVVRRSHLIATELAQIIDFAAASVRIVRDKARKRWKPMAASGGFRTADCLFFNRRARGAP